MARGYVGIGVYQPKHEVNVGTLLRSARSMGAAFTFQIGGSGARHADTTKSPRHTPLWQFPDFETFLACLPWEAQLVAVEIAPGAEPLETYRHPERAVYLLGNESRGIPEDVLRRCSAVVRLPGAYCLNVAVAGSVVLYDRLAKAAAGERDAQTQEAA